MYYDPNCDYLPQRPYESQTKAGVPQGSPFNLSQPQCCNESCQGATPNYAEACCGSRTSAGQQTKSYVNDGIPSVYHQYYQKRCPCGKMHYQQVTTVCGSVAEAAQQQCCAVVPRRRNGLDDEESAPCPPCVRSAYPCARSPQDEPYRPWCPPQSCCRAACTQYVEPEQPRRSLGIQPSQSLAVPDAGGPVCACTDDSSVEQEDTFGDDPCCCCQNNRVDESFSSPVYSDGNSTGAEDLSRESSERTVTVRKQITTPTATTFSQTNEITKRDVSVVVEPKAPSRTSSVRSLNNQPSKRRVSMSSTGSQARPSDVSASTNSVRSQPRISPTRPYNARSQASTSSMRSQNKPYASRASTHSTRSQPRMVDAEIMSQRDPVMDDDNLETISQRSQSRSRRSQSRDCRCPKYVDSTTQSCWKSGKICLCKSREPSPTQTCPETQTQCLCGVPGAKKLMPPGEQYLCCNCLEKANFKVTPKSCKFSVGTEAYAESFDKDMDNQSLQCTTGDCLSADAGNGGVPKTKIYKEASVQDQTNNSRSGGQNSRVRINNVPITETTIKRSFSKVIIEKSVEAGAGDECCICDNGIDGSTFDESGESRGKDGTTQTTKKPRKFLCFRKNKKSKNKT